MGSKSRQTIKIGVTGHRFTNIDDALRSGMVCAIDAIRENFNQSEILLYSALAEGADQLAAEVALANTMIDLVVPLPMQEMNYLQGFKTTEGRERFAALLKAAESVIRLPEQQSKTAAFQELGIYLASTCDCLIAVWNGVMNGKPGGTGDVVQSFLRQHKVVYWVYCSNPNSSSSQPRSVKKTMGDLEVLHTY